MTTILQFDTAENLSESLILVPRIEEEGVGAIVLEADAAAADNVERQSLDETDATGRKYPADIVGFVLTGIASNSSVDSHEKDIAFSDLTQKDFTSILKDLRDAPPPIFLSFQPPEKVEEARPEEEDSSTTSVPNTMARSKFLGDLSSWGSKIAAEAASSAVSIVNAASEVSERARASRHADMPASVHGNLQGSLFIQNTEGEFVILSQGMKVTTSSVLVVRQTALKACPPQRYAFQWYRTYCCEENTHENGEPKALLDDWIPLHDAVYAAYQPSATDVGHRLRCQVRISQDGSHNDGISESNDRADNNSTVIICTTHGVTSADQGLFDGAVQALVNGTKFSNLAGRGRADGLSFSIEIGKCSTYDKESKSTDTTSSIRIFQVDGSTAIPLHDEPLLGVIASTTTAVSRDFELVIPLERAQPMSAMLNDGHLRLSAVNRVTRETILLVLGIANYCGEKPVNIQTILYPGLPPPADTPVEEEVNHAMQAQVEVFEDVTPAKQPQADAVEFFTPQEMSKIDTPRNDRSQELDHEIQRVRLELAKAEGKARKSESLLASCREELDRNQRELEEIRSSLRLAQRSVNSQSDRIIELEKNVKSLQNEKAVLSAAVEARDGKLLRMAELQSAVNSLSEKVSKGDSMKLELNDMNQRYADISQDLEKVSNIEKECREELAQTRATVEDLQNRLSKEQVKGSASQSQLDSLQLKAQKLQAERNNYKQKADSLGKEVSRLCRNGLTLRDIEKIMYDEEARQMEVSLLKSQKRQALEDLHHYRTAYEQTVMAQKKAGLDNETMRALERVEELNRVVADMTEYVNAKEMQLETLKEVNQALSEELHMLAQANMSKNDI